MPEYFLITQEDGRDGKVTAQRVRKDRNKHWETFGIVELWDLPIPEIQLAIAMKALVERYR